MTHFTSEEAQADKAIQVKRPKNFQEWLQAGKSRGLTSSHPPSFPHLPILVIGAGPGGLSVMEALKSAGITFVGVEKSSDVGGVWNAANPDSPAYDGLVTISSKVTTHLDQPMPRSWPAYLPQAKALEYLQDFTNRHHLREFIRFETCVEALQKSPEGTWLAKLTRGGQTKEQEFRAVVNAAGTLNRSNPKYPPELWAEAQRSGIPTVHTADYKNPQGYEDKNVLIVGLGNSGAEIATQISRVARKTFLAIRTAPWIVPLWAFGIPADVFARTFGLPHSLRMKIFHPIQRWYIGHPVKLGFQAPKHDLLDIVPVCDRGLAAAIRKGKIVVRPTVKKIEAGQVHFRSEGLKKAPQPEQIDRIIFATGYSKNYPFLPKEFGDLDNPHFHLTFQLFHPEEPGLICLPYLNLHQGVWPILYEQGKAIAAYFKAETNTKNQFWDFRNRQKTPAPDCKGKILQASDEYGVDAELYTRLLRDFSKWLTAAPNPPLLNKPKSK